MLTLRKLGVSDARALVGGFEQWKAAGHPHSDKQELNGRVEAADLAATAGVKGSHQTAAQFLPAFGVAPPGDRP